jgi:puromycin-sensitive aminopeptidase
VEYEVRSPRDSEGMFDLLTYQKGGALLRMLEQYLGDARFREGVSHYLRRHAYGNTETNDLWDAIEETSGEPVRQMMDSWIWQPGYPLVSAALGDDRLVLRQQRFAFDGDALGEGAAATWLVPVHVRTGDRESRILLGDAPAVVELDDPAAPVVVNACGHGFYRVAYDHALRSRLAGEVLASLDTLERYNLVDDAWNEVVAGRLPAADYLAFLEGFGGERELAVWQAIVVGLRGLGRLLDDDAFPQFQARVAALLAPVVADLGDPTPGEHDLTAKLRGLLTTTLAVLGDDAATQARARELYDRNEEVPGATDPELVAAATTIVAATGDGATYERLLDAYRSAPTPQDQLRHLNALAEFDSEELVLRTCELAMSGEVKTQNAPFLLRLCIANRRHGVSAWRFVRQHWAEANEAFPRNTIVRMVDSVRLLTEESVVADVQGFFAEHPIEQAAKTLDQVLERQRVNAAVRAREEQRFAVALS